MLSSIQVRRESGTRVIICKLFFHLVCTWLACCSTLAERRISQDRFAVRQGQPRAVPFLCFVLQADLHLQYVLFNRSGAGTCESSESSVSAILCSNKCKVKSKERIKQIWKRKLNLPRFHSYFSSVVVVPQLTTVKSQRVTRCSSRGPRFLLDTPLLIALSMGQNKNKRVRCILVDWESLINIFNALFECLVWSVKKPTS